MRGAFTMAAPAPRVGTIHVHTYRPDAATVRYAVVIVHGTAGHGGCYERFATTLAAIGCAVYAIDLWGHGRSGGARGTFTMGDWLTDVDALVTLASEREAVPVVLLGASQGGEVAFAAAQIAKRAAGVICMNVLLASELALNRRVTFMRSRWAAKLGARVGDRLRISLPRVIDFAAAYREDPAVVAEKKKDPLYVWDYGFESYRSIFAHTPPRTAAENTTPVLVACGGNDPIVSARHCERAFDRMGGNKSFYRLDGAGHQLMLFHTERFARVVDGWVAHAVLSGRTDPFEPYGTLDAFHAAEQMASAQAERDRTLSAVDRALIRVNNGTLRAGNAYFAEERLTRTGRFTTAVVANIDDAAWSALIDELPRAVPKRMAVLGAGDGTGLARVIARHPELRRWQIEAYDVDEDAVLAAAVTHRHLTNVRWIAGDVRACLPHDYFGAVYAHGIFDHASDHLAIVKEAARALTPGGRFFYITPDRNWYTWLAFVAVGPRYLFGLGARSDVHDYRRFLRPREIDRLLNEQGLAPLAMRRGRHVGVIYRLDSLRIAWHARRRDPKPLDFVLRPPAAIGFLGEFFGAAEKA
ncbi:MAG: alpha/beta fold hydrolase [Deltaproteobacteria bacterium]|nr:alpha/beta fold hydrolase [Deltaproteobacteria bacterium]